MLNWCVSRPFAVSHKVFSILCLMALYKDLHAMTTEVRISRGAIKVDSRQPIACPNQKIHFYCDTNKNSTLWKLLDSESNVLHQMSYYISDQPAKQSILGLMTAELDNNRPMRSHIEFPYLPKFNNTKIVCTDEVVTNTFTYFTASAGTELPEPQHLKYYFITSEDIKVDWSRVDGAHHYTIITSFETESRYEVVQTNATSLIIRDYREGTVIQVYSVNVCNTKSSTFASVDITMANASWQEWIDVHYGIYIIVGVLCIVIALLIASTVFLGYKLKSIAKKTP